MRCSLSSALWPVLWFRVCGVWGAAMAPMVPYLGRGKDCLCVPNSVFCAIEVVSLSVVSAYSSAPYTCRLGTRLCCEENPAQSADKGKNTSYLLEDGALIVKVPSLQPYFDLQLRYSKVNTTNDKGVSEGQDNLTLESATEDYAEFHPFNANYPNLTDNVSSDVTEAPRGAFHTAKEAADKFLLTEVDFPVHVMGRNLNSTGELLNETLTRVGNSSVIDTGRDTTYQLQGNVTNDSNSTSHRSEGFGSVSVSSEESTLWLGKLPTSTEYYRQNSPRDSKIEQSRDSLFTLSLDHRSQTPLKPQVHLLNRKYAYFDLSDSNNLTSGTTKAENFTKDSLTFPAAPKSNKTVLPLEHIETHIMGNSSDLPETSVNSSSDTPVTSNTSSSFWLWFWG